MEEPVFTDGQSGHISLGEAALTLPESMTQNIEKNVKKNVILSFIYLINTTDYYKT